MKAVEELEVVVPMHGNTVPSDRVGSLPGQRLQVGVPWREEGQGRYARGDLALLAGTVPHPGTGLKPNRSDAMRPD